MTYRVIWGFSAYEDFISREAAQARADEIADETPIDRETYLKWPSVYTRDENGNFTVHVDDGWATGEEIEAEREPTVGNEVSA